MVAFWEQGDEESLRERGENVVMMVWVYAFWGFAAGHVNEFLRKLTYRRV